MRLHNILTNLVMLCLFSLTAFAQSADEQIAAASVLYGNNKYSEAAPKLEAALQAAPKHPKAAAVAFTLGRCRFELKQYDKAVAAFEKAVGYKDEKLNLSSLLGLGESALFAKQYDKSASALQSCLKEKLTPAQTPVVLYMLGQAYQQLKRNAEATTTYTRLYNEFPKFPDAHAACYFAGLMALRDKKNNEVRRHFQHLRAQFPKSEFVPQATLALAQLEFEQKRYTEARPLFESLLKDFPVSAKGKQIQGDAEDGLIQTLLELKDYNAASGRLETALSRLAAKDPQRFRALLSLGHCRYRNKEYDLAYASYLEAAKAEEVNVAAEALYWTGNAAQAQGKFSVAATQFVKFVSQNPKHELASKAQLKAADSYLSAKQTAQATAAFQTTLEKYPQSPEAQEARKTLDGMKQANQSNLLVTVRKDVAAGRFAQAETGLTTLLKSTSAPASAAELHYLLGIVHENLKRPAQAITAYQEGLRLLPDAKWAGEAHESVAWLLLGQKKWAEAEKSAKSALEKTLTKELEEQARLALLQAQLEQEKWDDTLATAKAIQDKQPQPAALATTTYVQALVYERQEKGEEADKLWNRIIMEFGTSEYAPEAYFRTAERLRKAEKWAEAGAKYTRVADDYPRSEFAIEARFQLAICLYRQEKWDEAATTYNAVGNNSKAGDLIPEALYWAGVAYDKAGKADSAIKSLNLLVEKHPKHTRVANAKVRLAALKAAKDKP